MADRIEQTADVPLPIRLNDGKEYRISRATVGDFAEFFTWIRAQQIAAIEQTPGLSPERRQELILALIGREITGAEYDSHLYSLPGMLHVIHRALARNHPDLTEAALPRLVDFGNLSFVFKATRKLEEARAKVPLDPPPPEPAPKGA